MSSLIRRFTSPGDSGGRFPGSAGWHTRRRDTANRTITPTPTETPPAAGAPLHELRGQAMRRMFPKLFHWRAGRPERSIALQVHAYLAQATSTADLELRIGTAERRVRAGG
jgi:hypothetical protein